MSLFPIAMDWDGSIVAQQTLFSRLGAVVPLRNIGEDLRVWAEPSCVLSVRQSWASLREEHHAPWLTFLGSGDYHHMTLVLLESLPADQRPSTLVIVDNHPDWFLETHPYHCGNWVGTALKTLPWLKQVILIGINSTDLMGFRFWHAPWDDLCRSRLRVYPYKIDKATIPFRRCTSGTSPAGSRNTWMGVEWTFPTLMTGGVEEVFKTIAESLHSESVYLSIDKDCLRRDQLTTDWDQGGLQEKELLAGVRHLSAGTRLCGVDICGDRARDPLKNWAKRLDTGRWFPGRVCRPTTQNDSEHERINLALLDILLERSP